jgi:glycerol-3-phosphate acyltransferase PlsY
MIEAPVISAASGYLLGALPFGWLVARARGVDIFSVGSRSPGATNVRRTLGPGPGNLVFALDAAKGAVAAGLPAVAGFPNVALNGVVALAAALLGHSFSCFTRFRGGKGVATGTGGFLVLLPWCTLIAAAGWLGVFYGTRYVSLASIFAAVTLPVAAFALGSPAPLTAMAGAVCLFVVVRHRSNIARLLSGTENRAGRKGAPPGHG